MRLIGLMGHKGAGKTSLARLLTAQGGTILSMAEPIKAMLVALGIPAESISDPLRKELPCAELLGCSPRYAMQTLGTEWGRRLISPEIWVSAMERRLDQERAPVAVIDDLRFENEVAMVRRRGGEVYILVRHDACDEHASEQLWRQYLIAETFPVLRNDRGRDGLEKIAHWILNGGTRHAPE